MSKRVEKIPNNIKLFMDSNLTPKQIIKVKSILESEYKFSERVIDEDVLCWTVPEFRKMIWTREISFFKPVAKEDLFPYDKPVVVPELEVKKEPVK